MPCIFSAAPGQSSAPEKMPVWQSAYEAPTKLRGQQNVKYVQSAYIELNTKLCGRRNVKHVQRSNCEDWPSIKQSHLLSYSNCSWIEKELREEDKTCHWPPQNTLNWGTSQGLRLRSLNDVVKKHFNAMSTFSLSSLLIWSSEAHAARK